VFDPVLSQALSQTHVLTYSLQSHVVHPVGAIDPFTGLNLYRGTCPSSHPVRLPMLLFETIWDTTPFIDLWPEDGSQPLVYSMGDP
jgi:hypothetical protein